MLAMERIGALLGVFAFLMATIYGFWTNSTELGIEWVGVIGLILGGLLGFTTRSATSTRFRATTASSARTAGGRSSWLRLPPSASSGWPSGGGSSSSARSSRCLPSSGGPSSTGRASTPSEASDAARVRMPLERV